MNLKAYSQIEDLMPVLQSTGIEIPRLRGLGLMKNEEPVNQTDLNEILHSMEILAVQNLCESFQHGTFKAAVRNSALQQTDVSRNTLFLTKTETLSAFAGTVSTAKNARLQNMPSNSIKKLSLTISKSSTNTQVETMYSSFTHVLVETTGITSMVHPL